MDRGVMVMVYVPATTRAEATETLFNVLQYGISAMRRQLDDGWVVGDFDPDPERGLIMWHNNR